MWTRACPLLTGTLAVGLVLTRRRLSQVQEELDRARAEAIAQRGRNGEPEPAQTAATATRTAAPSDERTPDVGPVPDLSSEWEQAVPPMDS